MQATFRRKRTLDDSDERETISYAVQRARAGDREALRYLYVRYADNVYSYVVSIVRDEHDAEDITQYVFAKLMTALKSYEQRAVPFSAWILRVAHNLAIDHLRAQRTIPTEEVRAPDAPADDDAHDNLTVLKEALRALPEDQREVVVLRHVLGLSPPEIAERLGRTESSVHGLHHRGRRALREALASMDSAPVVA